MARETSLKDVAFDWAPSSRGGKDAERREKKEAETEKDAISSNDITSRQQNVQDSRSRLEALREKNVHGDEINQQSGRDVELLKQQAREAEELGNKPLKRNEEKGLTDRDVIRDRESIQFTNQENTKIAIKKMERASGKMSAKDKKEELGKAARSASPMVDNKRNVKNITKRQIEKEVKKLQKNNTGLGNIKSSDLKGKDGLKKLKGLKEVNSVESRLGKKKSREVRANVSDAKHLSGSERRQLKKLDLSPEARAILSNVENISKKENKNEAKPKGRSINDLRGRGKNKKRVARRRTASSNQIAMRRDQGRDGR